eukprot:TRINITY_DN537_c0_g1_i4.p1 TRINITY_DN537_c0_g1~~TRINITY_DN537_c0_g1_i4.p1  ORF type:complete len:265 (-),score=37.12 TRINITY_DN537_c0_g1_i4:42-836(-)
MEEKEIQQKSEKVKLDIGGTIFVTKVQTLTNRSHYFSAMFSGRWLTKQEQDGTFFLDRDPSGFLQILNFLRGEAISFELFSPIELYRLQKDAEFYQIDDLTEALIKYELNSFDQTSAGPKVLISNDKRSATLWLAVHEKFSSSLVTIGGISSGTYTWRLRIDISPTLLLGVGVIKGGILNSDISSSKSFTSPQRLDESRWMEGDIIIVELNCDTNRVVIINERSTMSKSFQLPSCDTGWHLFVNLGSNAFSRDHVTICLPSNKH